MKASDFFDDAFYQCPVFAENLDDIDAEKHFPDCVGCSQIISFNKEHNRYFPNNVNRTDCEFSTAFTTLRRGMKNES